MLGPKHFHIPFTKRNMNLIVGWDCSSILWDDMPRRLTDSPQHALFAKSLATRESSHHSVQVDLRFSWLTLNAIVGRHYRIGACFICVNGQRRLPCTMTKAWLSRGFCTYETVQNPAISCRFLNDEIIWGLSKGPFLNLSQFQVFSFSHL